MKTSYTCNRCGVNLDYKPTNERSCSNCGYPLDLAEILKFLKANRSCIRKVQREEFSDVKEISISEAFRQCYEHIDMLFPERFNDLETVVSIANVKFRFVVNI